MQVKTVGVLGLGDFGQTVALELSKYGCEVIAIDNNAKNVQEVSDSVTYAAIGDFTDIDLLRDIGIEHCDIVIIGTGTNLESSVLAIVHCKKLGVKQILAKAKSVTYEEVLYEVGASSIISPERDSGIRLSSKILRNKLDELLRLDQDTALIEFKIPADWIGKSLIELDLRSKYHLNIIGMRKAKGEPLLTLSPKTILIDEIILVAIADDDTFERYDYLGYFS